MGLNGFRVEGLKFESRSPTTMFPWWRRQGLGEMGVGAGGVEAAAVVVMVLGGRRMPPKGCRTCCLSCSLNSLKADFRGLL